MLLITVAGMFGAILVAVVVFLSAGDDRREVRLALRGLADYDLPANVREQEMLKSIRERVLVPFMAKLSALLGRFTPAGYVQTVREKLVKAGNPAGLDADRFLTLKLIGAVSIVFWPFFAFNVADLSGFYGMIVIGLLWAIG